MIARTEAIVLRSMRYRETSKIVTLYTLSFGKVSVIAKGARETKSRFGASLEPMTHISSLFYKKPHRELHLLSQAEIVEEYRRLHTEYERMRVGYAIIELLQAVMHGEEEHPDVFHLTAAALRALETGTKNFPNVLYCYQVQLAGHLGFAMAFDACGSCGTPVDERTSGRLGFNPMMGTILDEACGGNEQRWIPVSLSTARILQRYSRITPDASMSIEMNGASRSEIGRVLRGHFGAHVETTRKLKGIGEGGGV